MTEAIAIQSDFLPMTAVQVRAQVNLVQEVMQAVMQEGQHFGKVPGCGDKPTLLKPGAEKLMMTFRLAADPQIEEVPTDDGLTFRVTCRILSQSSGTFLGAGVGECSSKEDKYNWRGIVSDKEWDATPEDRKRTKYTRNGETKQVRTNPPDIANTVLKMAKKRALVDAILTVTAASDCFTQDIEDMPAEVLGSRSNGNGSGKQAPKQPQSKSQGSGAQPQSTEHVVVIVESVSTKRGNKNGKDWQAWTIHAAGEKYGTFSESLAGIAVAGEIVKIGFTVGKFGKEVVSIVPWDVEPGHQEVVDPKGCPKKSGECAESKYDNALDVVCGLNNNAPCPYAGA